MFVATNLNRRAKPMIRLHTRKEREGQRKRVRRRRRRRRKKGRRVL